MASGGRGPLSTQKIYERQPNLFWVKSYHNVLIVIMASGRRGPLSTPKIYERQPNLFWIKDILEGGGPLLPKKCMKGSPISFGLRISRSATWQGVHWRMMITWIRIILTARTAWSPSSSWGKRGRIEAILQCSAHSSVMELRRMAVVIILVIVGLWPRRFCRGHQWRLLRLDGTGRRAEAAWG